jgi:hypothetical protein
VPEPQQSYLLEQSQNKAGPLRKQSRKEGRKRREGTGTGPVILAIWEVDMKRIWVQGQPGQIVYKNPSPSHLQNN